MKNIILLLALICAALVPAQAQIQYSTGMVAVTSTDTLSWTATAYADGQVVRDSIPNYIALKFKVPKFNVADTGGILYKWKLEVDSVSSGGNFDLWVLDDTVGVLATLTANHGTAQDRRVISNHRIAVVSFSCTPQGTAAAGAETQSQIVTQFEGYVMPSKKHTQLYGLLIARGAWTPKVRGVVRVTMWAEAN